MTMVHTHLFRYRIPGDGISPETQAPYLAPCHCGVSLSDVEQVTRPAPPLPPAPPSVEECCEVMHDAYEAAATAVGWETNPRSRVSWSDVPDENKATMRVAVQVLLEYLGGTRDRYGIPTGEHVARCGCRLNGRDLVQPCEQHANLITSGPYSIGTGEF